MQMRIKNIILSALAASFSLSLMAAPVKPGKIVVTQNDGSQLEIVGKGDERMKWAETTDGYSVLKLSSKHNWEYATLNSKGDMVSSGIMARNAEDRDDAEISFLKTCPKNLRFSAAQQNARKSQDVVEPVVSKAFRQGAPSNGQERKQPVILVEFPDRAFHFSKKDFDELLNTENLNEKKPWLTGSVLDYFLACSMGKYRFGADVYGPYKTKNNMEYYGANLNGNQGQDANARKMVEEAVLAASADGVDFSQYDYNKDGLVDAIHVIFAGMGEEANLDDPNSVWSHEWQLYPAVQVNGGVAVSTYSCSPERDADRPQKAMTSIGVIVHEMGHALGLPDFYDVNYNEQGMAVAMGTYSVMASGNYNNNGVTPAYYTAWERAQVGWLPVELVKTPYSVVMEPAMKSQKGFFYASPNGKEYFVVENRKKESWDQFLPGEGLIIYAVNEGTSGWKTNCINCNPSNRGFYIKQADGGKLSNKDFGPGTPFPGTTNNTAFTDATQPSSITASGYETKKPITDIRKDGDNILFDFMGGNDAATWVSSQEKQVGVEVATSATMYLSPNPAYDHIDIVSSSPIRDCSIYSIGGAIAIKQACSGERELNINISNIPNGFYFARLETDEGTRIIKFVKK